MPLLRLVKKIITRNIASISIYLGIFVVISVMMSQYGSKNSVEEFVSKTVKFSVIDEDQTVLTKHLVDGMI